MVATVRNDEGRLRLSLQSADCSSHDSDTPVREDELIELKEWFERSLLARAAGGAPLQVGRPASTLIRVVPLPVPRGQRHLGVRAVRVDGPVDPRDVPRIAARRIPADSQVGDVLGVGADLIGGAVVLEIDLEPLEMASPVSNRARAESLREDSASYTAGALV